MKIIQITQNEFLETMRRATFYYVGYQCMGVQFSTAATIKLWYQGIPQSLPTALQNSIGLHACGGTVTKTIHYGPGFSHYKTEDDKHTFYITEWPGGRDGSEIWAVPK